jgi:hypothetical protein
MLKYVYLLVFVAFGMTAHGQETDSLFAVRKSGKFAIRYTVKPRENVKMLAHRFYVSENIIEYANEYIDMRKLTAGTVINIPVAKENYLTSKPTLDPNFMPLYYYIVPKDDIAVLSTYIGITKNDLRIWNSLKGNTLHPDDVLFIGWVKMIAKDSTNPESELAYPAEKKKKVATVDTVKLAIPGGLDTTYNRQTSNGSNVLTEKGTAVFFEKAGKNDVYYAFHNATPRGTIIKVFNPGTGRTTYVKVLGPLPGTKLYAGSIIGISNAAREDLEIRDDKAWLELSYSPN